MVYHKVHLALTPAQIAKVKRGHKIRVAHHQIGHGHALHVHHENHMKIQKAHRAGKGVDLHIEHGEMHHDLMHGGSLWDDIKSGFNKYVKPVLSTAGDILANSLSYTNPQLAPVIQGVRGAAKDITGIGMKHMKKGKRSKVQHVNLVAQHDPMPQMQKKHHKGRRVATPAQLAALAKGRATRVAKNSRGGSFAPAGY